MGLRHFIEGTGKTKWICGALCAIFLLFIALIYTDGYRYFLSSYQNHITVGVFSDSYWEVQNGYSYRILEDAIALFEETHPGVTVEYTSGILKEDYSEWLAERLLSDDAPDVFFVLAEDFNGLAQIGALQDLAPLAGTDPSFVREDFYSSAYAYGQYDGTQYALPYECAPKLMFVNKTILDREGIAAPDEDWTWEEFYDICKRVTKDTDQNGLPDQFGVFGYTWKEAFDANGVKLFNQKGTRCYLADDNVEPALLFLERLTELNNGYTATEKDFDLGNVAFWPMLFSEYRAYKPYPLSVKKYSSFEWSCIPMPAGPDGENISTLDTLLVAMNANTKKEAYAWDFMKTLTCDPMIQSEIFRYSEGVSVLKKVTESEETLRRLLEDSGDSNSLNLRILSDAVEHAVVAPAFRNYKDAMAQVDKAVSAILEGDSNISMDQIIWNRTLNRYLERQ